MEFEHILMYLTLLQSAKDKIIKSKCQINKRWGRWCEPNKPKLKCNGYSFNYCNGYSWIANRW